MTAQQWAAAALAYKASYHAIQAAGYERLSRQPGFESQRARFARKADGHDRQAKRFLAKLRRLDAQIARAKRKAAK